MFIKFIWLIDYIIIIEKNVSLLLDFENRNLLDSSKARERSKYKRKLFVNL